MGRASRVAVAASNRQPDISAHPSVAIRPPRLDILWPDADYRAVYRESGLEVMEMHKPLGRADEPHAWVSELTIAPWVIYVLTRG